MTPHRAPRWRHLLLPALLLAALPWLSALARIVPVATWSQLWTACTTALPGDTIVIAPGVYTVTGVTRINIVGRPGPVLVKGATGDRGDVIVEGQGQDDASVEMVFQLENSPGWTFRDLTTRRSYYHGFKFDLGSTDCRLINVVMRDHGESGVKGTSDPVADIYPDRLLIDSCDIGFTAPTGGTRTVVEGVDGVGVNDWIIRRSRFVNIQKNGNPAYAVFTKGNSSNTIIEACRFENCFIGASFGGGGTAPQFFRDGDQTYEHRNGIIRNNIFIGCSDAGVYINKGHDAKVYHNTLFQCVLTIQYRYAESTGWVRNNLVVPSPTNPGEPVVRLRNGATLQADEQNITGAAGDFVNASGAMNGMDLHLLASSAAVDAGVVPGADVPTDFEGQPRPFGSGYDIGADEMGTVPVELSLFQVQRTADGVDVHWRTEREQGSARFEIWRTADAASGRWCCAGVVAAGGDTDGPRDYAWHDADAPGGDLWYRLRLVDADGSVQWSPTLRCDARVSMHGDVLLSVFPNPASGAICVDYEAKDAGPVSITVFDMAGCAVFDVQSGLSQVAGRHSVSIPVSSLHQGVHMVRVRFRDGDRIAKIVVE